MTGVTQEEQVAITSESLKALAMDKGWARTYAWPAIKKFILTKPLGAAGGLIVLLMLLTAIFAEVLAPYDPFEINQRLQFKPPTCLLYTSPSPRD